MQIHIKTEQAHGGVWDGRPAKLRRLCIVEQSVGVRTPRVQDRFSCISSGFLCISKSMFMDNALCTYVCMHARKHARPPARPHIRTCACVCMRT